MKLVEVESRGQAKAKSWGGEIPNKSFSQEIPYKSKIFPTN
jgi:hypothetical protein